MSRFQLQYIYYVQKNDFTCSVHNNLRKKGLKGCTTYECFDAGQKTAQITCKGIRWRDNSQAAPKTFDAFLVVRQLHEMLWYLAQTYSLQNNEKLKAISIQKYPQSQRKKLMEKPSLVKTLQTMIYVVLI